MRTNKLKKTGFRITFENGETATKYLQPITPCFCNSDITEEELKDIIIKLRKKSNRYEVSHFLDEIRKEGKIEINKKYKTSDDKRTKLYIKNEIYYAKWGNEYYPINGEFKKYSGSDIPKEYITKLDGVFNKSNLKEKVQSIDANYKTFAEHLNCTFSTYDINTCIRKIHFIAQTFHETNGFIDSVEKGGKSTYGGGKDFKGRGLIHITHDYNYLPYYDEARKNGTYIDDNDNKKEFFKLYQYKNKSRESIDEFIARKNKEKIEHNFPNDFVKDDLVPFAKKLGNDLMHVCYSAGFFWKSNKINSLATNDDSNGVSNKINRGDQLPLRKTYVNYLKEIFNYDNCKN